MTDRSDDARRTGRETDSARRRFLRALGAGTAVTALGGVATAQETTEGGTTQGETTQETTRSADGGIDPVFGFSALTPDETPPVEPDHEVVLDILEREAWIPEFAFDPAGLAIEPGDTVRFTLDTPDHTITAYHPQLGRTQRVPDGVPPISSPVLGLDAYWLYTFETPGVYDLYCAPHELFGMVVRLVVGEASGPGAEPIEEEGGDLRPPALTAALVLSDPALDPENIVESGTVGWDEIDEENKRPLLAPVEGGGEGGTRTTEAGTTDGGRGRRENR